MLVLTRKMKQKIMIGQDVVLTVVDIRHGKVKIGFEAPKTLAIHREEVFEAIQKGEGKDRR
jgi:carbon storage regulator